MIARPDTGKLRQRKSLRELLTEYFNEDELRNFAFDFGLDWEQLPGENKGAKARAIIEAAEHDGRLYMLVGECAKARPHLDWLDAQTMHDSGEDDDGI